MSAADLAVAGGTGADTDAATLARVLTTLETVILGKPRQIRLCLACLLARGHLLIEDVPGVGKTTLAHALAHVLGLSWQRVQFTSDLCPRTSSECRYSIAPASSSASAADRSSLNYCWRMR